MREGEGVININNVDRELFETAEALSNLGLWVKIENATGTLTVYRDGVEIGKLWFPVEDSRPPR